MLVTRKEEVAQGAGGEANETRPRQVTQVDGLVGLGVLYLPRVLLSPGTGHSLIEKVVIRGNQ